MPFIQPTPDNQLSGEEVVQLGRPHVYAWQRDGVWLYVGFSTNGMSRLVEHEVILIRRRHTRVRHIQPYETIVLPTDNFLFWHHPQDDLSVLRRLELDLIYAHHPRYNK